MRKARVFLSVIGAVLLAWSCAQVMPITGGEKDTTPPQITESAPKNFATNYTGGRIILEFDEYIQTKGLSQNVVVSPPLKNEPEFISKTKRVVMIINDTLKPNTTYNINFGEGIQDFTENNPLDSNVFVFSTGDYVDSLSFSGVVKDAYTLQPVKDVLVMAYSNVADSVPTVERPSYFSKSDANGKFSINYMKEGDYRVFVLEDLNKNYLFDLPNEKIAFKDSSFSVLDSDTLAFKFFKEDNAPQYIKSKKAEFFGKVSVVFNRPLSNYSPGYGGSFNILKGSVPEKAMLQEYLADDSLYLWFPQGLEDTLVLEAFDDTGIIDTLKMTLPDKNEFLEEVEKGKQKFNLKITPSTDGKTHEFFKPLSFTANHPLSKYSYDRVIFSVNGDTVELDAEQAQTPPIEKLLLETNTMRTKLFYYPWKPNTKYVITFLPESFTDIFGLTNDTLEFIFETKPIEDYGNLKLKIEPTVNSKYFYQLLIEGTTKPLDDGGFTGDTTLFYKYIKPGKYGVRLVYDTNGDGQWTTGDYEENRQPERVIYYPEPIEIRANWDMELQWLIED
mgnify:CR=1 FL=1